MISKFPRTKIFQRFPKRKFKLAKQNIESPALRLNAPNSKTFRSRFFPLKFLPSWSEDVPHDFLGAKDRFVLTPPQCLPGVQGILSKVIGKWLFSTNDEEVEDEAILHASTMKREGNRGISPDFALQPTNLEAFACGLDCSVLDHRYASHNCGRATTKISSSSSVSVDDFGSFRFNRAAGVR